MPIVTVSPAAASVTKTPLAARHKWALLLTAVLFERLFWEQWLGLNGLLFMGTAVALQLGLLPRPHWGARPFWVAVGGTLLSGVLMALYGSVMAGVAGWVSLALVLALARWPALRSVGYALLTSLENFLHAGPAAAQAFWPAGRTADQVRRGWFYGRLLGLPVTALLVFHGLFVLANPRYARLTEQLTEALLRWVEWLYKAISVSHVLFW